MRCPKRSGVCEVLPASPEWLSMPLLGFWWRLVSGLARRLPVERSPPCLQRMGSAVIDKAPAARAHPRLRALGGHLWPTVRGPGQGSVAEGGALAGSARRRKPAGARHGGRSGGRPVGSGSRCALVAGRPDRAALRGGPSAEPGSSADRAPGRELSARRARWPCWAVVLAAHAVRRSGALPAVLPATPARAGGPLPPRFPAAQRPGPRQRCSPWREYLRGTAPAVSEMGRPFGGRASCFGRGAAGCRWFTSVGRRGSMNKPSVRGEHSGRPAGQRRRRAPGMRRLPCSWAAVAWARAGVPPGRCGGVHHRGRQPAVAIPLTPRCVTAISGGWPFAPRRTPGVRCCTAAGEGGAGRQRLRRGVRRGRRKGSGRVDGAARVLEVTSCAP